MSVLEQSAVGSGRSKPSRSGYAKSRVTRAQILAAALAEASERGLHRTSVSRIAARADTAVGSVNYHFGSREQLLRETMRELITELYGRLAAVDAEHSAGRAGRQADFFARHRSEMLAYVQYLRNNPAHLRLVDEIKILEPDLYRQGVADWVELVSGKLRAGIAEGSLRSMDDAELYATAHFIVGARQFLEDLMDEVGSDEYVVDAYMRLIRDGVGRRPVRERTRVQKKGGRS